MTNIELIVRELKANYAGRTWHGTALRPMLDGVDEQKAYEHLIPNARSIAELLAHIVAWNEIVQRRVAGETFEVSAEMDFPPVRGVAWKDLVNRLEAAHERLIATVSKLEDGYLQSTVVGKKHSVYVELHGLMHHNTYHAAQIAMLKKY